MNEQDLINAISDMPIEKWIPFIEHWREWINSDVIFNKKFANVNTIALLRSLREYCNDHYNPDNH